MADRAASRAVPQAGNDRRTHQGAGHGPSLEGDRDRLLAVLNIAAVTGAAATIDPATTAARTDHSPDAWAPLWAAVRVAHEVSTQIIAERGKRTPEAEWRLQDTIRALNVERAWASHELNAGSGPPKSWCERYAANAAWGIALLATLRDAPAVWLRRLRMCRRGNDCPAPLFVSGSGTDTAYCSAACRTGDPRSRRRTDGARPKCSRKSPRRTTSQSR
jgi:hypothetical protein